jgi:glycosyltransferase involved in cell wall biosynthesis
MEHNPVTIVIPTKNRSDLLRKCITSLVRTVDAAYVKVVVVDDFSEEDSARQYLRELASEKPLSCEVIKPQSQSTAFNFAQLINEGVARADTSLVLLLNNDIEALERGWLEDMVGWMSIDGVGAVGAKLLYPNSTIQHAGVIVGSHGGLADHAFHGLGKDIFGLNFLTHAARNVTAVTAACMLTSKAAFAAVNGFDQEQFAMEYNDVDYCLRLGQAGYRTVFTPQATLMHRCSQSRGTDFRPREHVNFLHRYPDIRDPFYNESLDRDQMQGAIDSRHFVHTERIGKLKVLMLSHNLNLEGAPIVLFDQAAYFVAEGGYEVTIISPIDGPLRQRCEKAGISLSFVKEPFPRAMENRFSYDARLQDIGQQLNVGSFDLVICNTLASAWGVALARIFNLPVIWQVHESVTVDHFFGHTKSLTDLVTTSFGLADQVVFESSSTRRLFERYSGADNFRLIPGSIDVDAIDKFCESHDRGSIRRKHGIDLDTIVVSLIGTTCARKGQHTFLEAIRQLQSKCALNLDKVLFLMVGGRESPYLDFLRDQVAASDVVNLRIVEEREDVDDFFRLSDIFVCASFQESFPRVVLLAMAFKLGIVTTNVFGIPEMVSDGSEGLLISAGDVAEMADGIQSLVQDPRKRRELGDKAHAKVTRLFNNRVQLRKRLDLTKEIVSRHV